MICPRCTEQTKMVVMWQRTNYYTNRNIIESYTTWYCPTCRYHQNEYKETVKPTPPPLFTYAPRNIHQKFWESIANNTLSNRKGTPMGMSTHLTAITPPHEKWTQMKAIYDAYIQGNLPVPDDIMRFFNHEQPDNDGVKVSLYNHAAVKEYETKNGMAYDVDITKLPKDTTILRFENTW